MLGLPASFFDQAVTKLKTICDACAIPMDAALLAANGSGDIMAAERARRATGAAPAAAAADGGTLAVVSPGSMEPTRELEAESFLGQQAEQERRRINSMRRCSRN